MRRGRTRCRAVLAMLACTALAAALAACTKPLASATVNKDIDFVSRSFAAVPNDLYYAVRLALQQYGYAIASENLSAGVITTTWIPVTSDSHYMPFFGRRDYGVTNSYHQLEVQIVPGEGRAQVRVGSRVKTLLANYKSSGFEERKVLGAVGDALRKGEPALTNLGLDE